MRLGAPLSVIDRLLTLSTQYAVPELFMGPLCVTLSNPTHQLTDPTQSTTSGKIWTQPNTSNNGAYSLIVTYFDTQNLSRTFSQASINLFMFFTDQQTDILA